MRRRKFLRTISMAAVAAPILTQLDSFSAGCSASEMRFGDLLIRCRATDHYEFLFTPSRPRPLRLLQLADTHFHPEDETNRATEQMLRAIVEREKPDFVIHTGDFVNNDSKKPVEWTGMDILNGLQLPWTLCFGNHDYPVHNAPGALPLDQIRMNMERGFQGYVDSDIGRHYCYRHDLLSQDNDRPNACLFFFQVGYAKGDRRISDPQLAWFEQQLKRDEERRVAAPITVFVHIPLLEYKNLFDSGNAIGERGEDVCFDSDTGESFRRFAASRRVVGVFCGHDHVNNYHGAWQGVELAYGRVSGWGGYGPANWKRGGRLITLDLQNPNPFPFHTEVF